MRLFINATLTFAFVVFVTGMVPVSAQQLERIKAMKGEFAAVQDPQLVHLRPSMAR